MKNYVVLFMPNFILESFIGIYKISDENPRSVNFYMPNVHEWRKTCDCSWTGRVPIAILQTIRKYIPYSNYHFHQAMTFKHRMLRINFRIIFIPKSWYPLGNQTLKSWSFIRWCQPEKCKSVRLIYEFCVFEDYLFNLVDNFSCCDRTYYYSKTA